MGSTLPTVHLGHSGARLAVSVRSLSTLAKSIESSAAQMKADAATTHPMTVLRRFRAARADLKTVKNALRSTERDLRDAVEILEGANLYPTGPYSKAAAELRHLSDGLKEAGSQLVRAKAISAVDDSLGRLKMTLARVRDEISDGDRREDIAHSKFSVAFFAAMERLEPTTKLGFSLSEAKELLGWSFIPDDDRPLPAPDFSPFAPLDSLGRKAAVLMSMVRTRHAAQVAAGSAALKKAAKGLKTPTKRDSFGAALKSLGGVNG